jgi:hypothetical protein
MKFRPCDLAHLQPVSAHSKLAQWIRDNAPTHFSLEEALADFAYQLRMGRN